MGQTPETEKGKRANKQAKPLWKSRTGPPLQVACTINRREKTIEREKKKKRTCFFLSYIYIYIFFPDGTKGGSNQRDRERREEFGFVHENKSGRYVRYLYATANRLATTNQNILPVYSPLSLRANPPDSSFPFHPSPSTWPSFFFSKKN